MLASLIEEGRFLGACLTRNGHGDRFSEVLLSEGLCESRNSFGFSRW
jgi:hypothetical protein